MIAVTGGTGFIGRHVMRRLIAMRGKTRIRMLLLPQEMPFADFPEAEQVAADLATGEGVKKALEGADTVIHLAAKNIDLDGTGFERINVGGTACLCSAAQETGCSRFLYVSSVGVYGHRRFEEADETTPVCPDTAFSRSKAEAEKIVLEAHRKGGFQAVILRHRFVYGEGDRYVLPRMIRAAQKMPFLLNHGKAEMSFILAEDLAGIIGRFACEAIQSDALPVYHVTDGCPVSLKEVIGAICDAYGLDPPVRSLPYGLLYPPVKLFEKLTARDPEKSSSPVSSIRLRFAGVTQSFSNRKLLSRFPDMKLTPFKEGFPLLAGYYRQFLETR